MVINPALIHVIRVLQIVVEVVEDIVDAILPRERGPKGPPKRGPRKREQIMTTAPGRTKRRRGRSTR
jgi:hypothetical protein